MCQRSVLFKDNLSFEKIFAQANKFFIYHISKIFISILTFLIN